MQPEDVSRVLHVPDLQELAKVIQDGISSNFESVSVSAVQCPELNEIGCSGFGGNSCICDVGGVNNMEYVVNTNKFHFDMKNIAEQVGIKNGVIIGAAASKPDCSVTHDNSELMPCLNLSQGKNLTKEAYVNKLNGEGVLADYPHSELSSLGNLLICEDVAGEYVIKIEASKRTGKLNFVNAIRMAILNHYGNDKQIGMGGFFIIHEGAIKSHIMPTFPTKDSPNDPSWLKYFEVPSPLVCLSVFVSNDTHGDELRLEHTHFWAKDGSTGGHYHNDITPDTVKYEAYYKPASTLWRIGKAVAPEKK